MPIDGHRIERALRAKGATRECEACGERDWAIADHPTLLTAVDLDSNAVLTPRGEMQALGFIVVACNNCGLARLHRMTQLDLDDLAES